VPQFGIAKLGNITPITMVYGRYNYSFHGVYKPTFTSLGGQHLVWIKKRSARPGKATKTMERSTHFNGKINYFEWAMFNSYVKLPEIYDMQN
jgi:hypothetical protein